MIRHDKWYYYRRIDRCRDLRGERFDPPVHLWLLRNERCRKENFKSKYQDKSLINNDICNYQKAGNPGHSESNQDFANKNITKTVDPPRIAPDRLHFEEKTKSMISCCLAAYSTASASESAIAS